MDNKRLLVFGVLALALFFGWEAWLKSRYPEMYASQNASAPATAGLSQSAPAAEANVLLRGQRISVRTDLLRAEIDTTGADLRHLELLKHGAYVEQPSIFAQVKGWFSSAPAKPKTQAKPFVLMQDEGDHLYVAQSGLLGEGLPNHRSVFTAQQTSYQLVDGQNEVAVRLESANGSGVKLVKTYTFKRGSYVVDVKQEVINGSDQPVSTGAYFRLLRDDKTPAGAPSGMGATSYTGPALYTDAEKFNKIDFEDLSEGKAKFAKEAKDGWVAMLQQYFASAWIVSPLQGQSVCAQVACRYDIKPVDQGFFSAGVQVDLPQIAPGGKHESMLPLFVGPQETRVAKTVAKDFELIKDYGWLTVLAVPLFWFLDKIHLLVGNWGWAIILLTVTIKAVFYPLSAASYRSMAKMRALAPRMQQMKENYGDDKMGFQQAVMEMYRTEKVNPLGGCLPIMVQIPVFMALYWTLMAAVELRQTPWLGWVTDLSLRDPYLILPLLMAVTMYIQSHFSPPPADPVQAKIMKFMPLVFSLMFFMFPAGLVLYWVVNNTLSILQQWYITRQSEKEAAAAKAR